MASKRGRPPHPGLLTPTEEKVLALIGEGLQNSEIATRLGVTVNTVRFHVSNLLAKSEATDRGSLRNWRPGSDSPSRWRPPALGLLFAKFVGVAVGAGAIAALTLATLPGGGGHEDAAPPTNERPGTFSGAVVGMLTREPGGLVVTEPGGSSFKLTSEMTFARLVGSQVFIVGKVEGDTLTPMGGSPVGPHSRCAGVLADTGGTISVGGSCRGMELSGVPVERLLALRSEKVTVTILPCTASRGGRVDDPPIDAFGDERTRDCASSPVGGTLAQR